MLSLLLAFALITDNDPNQQEYDRRQMDITLIVINSFAFILLILSLCGLIPCVRNRINKRAEHIARSKVIPTDDDGDAEVTPVQNVKVMPQREADAQQELRSWGEGRAGEVATATYL